MKEAGSTQGVFADEDGGVHEEQRRKGQRADS
jgi:hypothetical protein